MKLKADEIDQHILSSLYKYVFLSSHNPSLNACLFKSMQ